MRQDAGNKLLAAPPPESRPKRLWIGLRLLHDWRQELAAISFGRTGGRRMHFLELLFLGWLLFGLLTIAGLSWMLKKATEALNDPDRAALRSGLRTPANVAGD